MHDRMANEGQKGAQPADDSGSFFRFQQLCEEIGKDSSYSNKTAIVANFIKKFKYVEMLRFEHTYIMTI